MNEAYENLMRTRIQAAQSEAYLGMALFAGFILLLGNENSILIYPSCNLHCHRLLHLKKIPW